MHTPCLRLSNLQDERDVIDHFVALSPKGKHPIGASREHRVQSADSIFSFTGEVNLPELPPEKTETQGNSETASPNGCTVPLFTNCPYDPSICFRRAFSISPGT